MWTAVSTILSIIKRILASKDKLDKDKLDKAVVEADKEAVNEYLNSRLRIAIIAILLMGANGCQSYTVISADKEVIPMTHNGIDGWFVPNARMLEIIHQLNKETL